MMRVNTMTTIPVELKREAQKRGLNFSALLEEALKQKLAGSAYISPSEKARLEELETEKAEKEKQVRAKLAYLDDVKATCEMIDKIEDLKNKEAFLAGDAPENFTDDKDPQVKVWDDLLEEIRGRGLRIGLVDLKRYWRFCKYGELGIKVDKEGM